ncbi:response regulator transcription factor [Paenibacillus sabinae]|uniref:AraC family transcriptional regulator n=1 Tax=Paenibacillus sabinae T27 TaxID=1268072 RepID=X4ZM81_9BACL|nr:response regulator [Paenibacillus sabinae]AHV98327.1 AraC family transcriptional regulator [Paenibacillus sabinae T27]
MINVLIVDDDKLVRKGLISAMPWNEFGMQVVGEAGNGGKALEFMETQQVDLLLTDLGMPVMSGIELMRHARQRYPRLHIVVLTLHQDFDYIQEALRLGAIDYIAKVQLEKEQFEEVLGRITDRMQNMMELNRKKIHLDDVNTRYEQAFVLQSMDHESHQCWADEFELHLEEVQLEVERNCMLWAAPKSKSDELGAKLSELVPAVPEGSLLVLQDIYNLTWKEIQTWILDYTKVLFYEYSPDRPFVSVSMTEDIKQPAETKDEDVNKIKEIWISAPWSYNDTVYEQLLLDLKSARLNKSQLMGVLYSLVMEWNHLFAYTKIGKIAMIHNFHSWHQVRQWMDQTRETIRKAAERTVYSPEIVDCVRKAVLIMRSEMNQAFTAAELSLRFNISRNYFSQCFKDLMGKTFNEYSRSIRIEKAKEYLLNTKHNVAWIAEQTGYADEKYFSRTFRELTGMLPSEYRQANRNAPQS